jgi:AmmeMemoRadiSam system protein B
MSDRSATGRRPAHAGSFYPRDPARLLRDVDEYLADASRRGAAAIPADIAATSDAAPAPIGLVVPHAGHMFSGHVAARGWAALGPDRVDTVVLAGTNHFAGWFAGVGVWAGGPWETPIGPCPIDVELSRAIEALGRPFVATVDAHLEEHSIEVQVPFLLRACPSARFVPLLVSAPPSDCRDAGRRLGELLRERRAAGQRIALVASSDLTHYPTEARAHEVDRRTLEPILALDPWELERREANLRLERMPGVACGLCGLDPVLCTLSAVREMGASTGILLAYATSADVPEGGPDRVVGYASVAFVA